MISSEEFISKVCNAFRKAVESASEVTIEGREREFRRGLARYLFDEILGWEGYSKIGEIYDIVCFDDENFPIILVETKWGVKPTREIKEDLRRRIEDLGSVKYGVFASERDFILYNHVDFKLVEVTEINVAEAIGVARGEYGLSETGKKRILKLEVLKRERLVVREDPEYFQKTYKEISVAKGEGIKSLIENLKVIVGEFTRVFTDFFESYLKRSDHSGKCLRDTFNDWLKLSMKHEEFEKGDDDQKRKITETFCRETAYVLIGRLLFIRICEDKGVLEQRLSGSSLADFLRLYERRKRENIYLLAFEDSREEIKKYYRHLHELGYFDWWVIEEVQRQTLSPDDVNIQERLESSLNYSLRKALRLLNRYDFAQVNRDILGDVYQGYLPPDERKCLGEFYTPIEIVKYILDAVGYKPENEIRGKKLLDPACGSGGFLVEATQRLIERYKRVGFNLKDPDSAKQVIEECIHSIYGLDIHPFACFISEMNLLFQLVDLYDIVKQKYRYYELPRINIYRTDSLAPTGESIELTEFSDNYRHKMLIEEAKGANNVKIEKFDYVVGNPPYVKIEKIPLEHRERYKKWYRSAFYRFDLYILFIEQGVKWLKNGGKLGFIVSNMFMKKDSGSELRRYIRSECVFEHLVDFGDSGVFAEVTNYPVIIVLRKEKMKDYEIKCVVVKESMEDLLEDVKKHVVLGKYQSTAYEIFQASSDILDMEQWNFLPKDEMEIIKKLENLGTPLDKIAHVHRGLTTGANEIFIIDEEIAKKYSLERELIKPIIRGENVKKWKVDWDGSLVIYPHTSRGISVDISRFKNLHEYLKQHKLRLEKRYCCVRKKNSRKWYELHDAGEPVWFETAKIIVCGISKRNEFAYDEEGIYYCLDSTFFIVPREAVDLKYLLGLLNSQLLEFYFKHIATIKSGGYYEYRSQFLNRLPIKLVKNDEEREIANQISQCVSQILGLKEQSLSIKRKLNRFPYSYFEDDWSFDKLVNVAKAISLSKESYTISEKSLRADYKLRDLIDGKETFRIILAQTNI